MKFFSILFFSCLVSTAFANPIELTPRAYQGDMQFGFGCSYFAKDSMQWSLLMIVDQSLEDTTFAAIYNTKTKKYLSDWEPLATSGNMINISKTNFQEVSNLLLSLSDSEIHFKNNHSNHDVTYFFPLADYRSKHPDYFIDNVNQAKGCLIDLKDLPRN